MRLIELFDKPYHIQWDLSDPRDITATFHTQKGNKVLVNFVDLSYEVVEVNFMIEIEDERGFVTRTFDATGTGDAPRIFATVLRAILDYAQEKEPDYLWFSTKLSETSRIRLYASMIARFIRDSDGYELVPSAQWGRLPDGVENLIRGQSMGFKGWLIKDRRLT